MQDKLKQLELLITQTLARQKELTSENVTLKNRLRILEDDRSELKEVQQELRELKEWKKNAQSVLRKVSAKIDKEIEKAAAQQEKIV